MLYLLVLLAVLYFCLHPPGKGSMMNSQPCYISCTNRKQIRHTTIHCSPWEKHQPTAQPASSAQLVLPQGNCSPGTVTARLVPLWQGHRAHTALETIWDPEGLQNEAEASWLKPGLVGWKSHKWTVGTLLERVEGVQCFLCLQSRPWAGHGNTRMRLLLCSRLPKKGVEDCWWVFQKLAVWHRD